MSPSRESGFTLVELLVALTLGAIIVGVLGQAVAIGLKTTTSTATTLVDAVHSRALTADLLSDVGGADLVGTTGAPCTPALPVETTLWTKDADGVVAAYFVEHTAADPGAGTEAFNQLKRQTCTGQPVTLAGWPDSTVPAAPPPAPTILCDGRPVCGGEHTLAHDLSAAAMEVVLDDVTGFPDPEEDPVGTYLISVGSETMTATKLDPVTKTLTVTRTSGVLHLAAATVKVTYKPAEVSVRVPRSDSADCDDAATCDGDDDYNLTVAPTTS